MSNAAEYPNNVRFAPVVAEGLEVLAGELGLTVETLPAYSVTPIRVAGVEVRFIGPDRFQGATVEILAPDGIFGATFHYREKRRPGQPTVWTYPGTRLNVVLKRSPNTPELVERNDEERRARWAYYQATEGAAG
ncbi:hypothetical protein D3C72_1208600 [compost metagenome]